MDKDLLKKKLHEQIDAIEDEMALHMLHEAAVEYGKVEEAREDLTPAQVEKLQKSLEQANNGETVSHEEAKKRMKEWLTR